MHSKIQLIDFTLQGLAPFRLQGDKPFAELWMGDHPSGPARVQSPSGKDAPKKKDEKKHLCEKLRKKKKQVFSRVLLTIAQSLFGLIAWYGIGLNFDEFCRLGLHPCGFMHWQESKS